MYDLELLLGRQPFHLGGEDVQKIAIRLFRVLLMSQENDQGSEDVISHYIILNVGDFLEYD